MMYHRGAPFGSSPPSAFPRDPLVTCFRDVLCDWLAAGQLVFVTCFRKVRWDWLAGRLAGVHRVCTSEGVVPRGTPPRDRVCTSGHRVCTSGEGKPIPQGKGREGASLSISITTCSISISMSTKTRSFRCRCRSRSISISITSLTRRRVGGFLERPC